MNRPTTICDRCKEYARCCLNYDGDNCRKSRTVEPTNADRIRSMTDEELAEYLYVKTCEDGYPQFTSRNDWLEWLRQEAE